MEKDIEAMKHLEEFMQRDTFKNVIKEAFAEAAPDVMRTLAPVILKEWLNEQFSAFGRFSFYGLLSLAFAGLCYLALVGSGWAHK